MVVGSLTLPYHKPLSKIITALQLILKNTPKYFKPHRKELGTLHKLHKTNKQPATSGEDVLKDLETIEKSYRNQIKLSK